MATKRNMSRTRTTIEQAETEKEIMALYTFFSCASPTAVRCVNVYALPLRLALDLNRHLCKLLFKCAWWHVSSMNIILKPHLRIAEPWKILCRRLGTLGLERLDWVMRGREGVGKGRVCLDLTLVHQMAKCTQECFRELQLLRWKLLICSQFGILLFEKSIEIRFLPWSRMDCLKWTKKPSTVKVLAAAAEALLAVVAGKKLKMRSRLRAYRGCIPSTKKLAALHRLWKCAWCAKNTCITWSTVRSKWERENEKYKKCVIFLRAYLDYWRSCVQCLNVVLFCLSRFLPCGVRVYIPFLFFHFCLPFSSSYQCM